MPVRNNQDPTHCPELDFDKPFERDYLLELFDYNNVDSVFSGHTHFEKMDIPKFKNVKQYLMTSITFQNTWHSKESDINYGPDIPSYYQGQFRPCKMSQIVWAVRYGQKINFQSDRCWR